MDKNATNANDKIILPKSLQHEMIKFFLQAYSKNNAKHDKATPATPIKSKE